MLRCPPCGALVESSFAYCPACGARQPAAPPSRAEAPAGQNMPWLLPLLAVLVASMILIGVVAYYYAPGPSVTPPPSLVVDLLSPYYVGAAATIAVSYVYPATPPQAFLVSLSVNGTAGAAVPMPTASGIGFGNVVTPLGYPFRIDWSDVDSNDLLSTGDSFTITPLRSPPPCCLYETFAILRQNDGGLAASVSFSSPAGVAVIPVVSFGTPSRGTPTNLWIPVNYVDPGTAPDYLRYQIVVGGNASATAPVYPYGYVGNVSVAGGEYIVAWYDSSYDALVDAGDAFNITLVSGSWPATGTPMGFYLEWYDGTTLASATWTA